MTPLRFITARLMRDQGLLSSLSVAQPDLLAALRGKTVALVGNARALANTQMGEEIDAHDIVIRINLAPMPYAETHGTRTDWLGLATRISKSDRDRIKPGASCGCRTSASGWTMTARPRRGFTCIHWMITLACRTSLAHSRPQARC